MCVCVRACVLDDLVELEAAAQVLKCCVRCLITQGPTVK